MYSGIKIQFQNVKVMAILGVFDKLNCHIPHDQHDHQIATDQPTSARLIFAICGSLPYFGSHWRIEK